jgi:Arc/MetJ-type ribon-helix-helix transcriptional regulator
MEVTLPVDLKSQVEQELAAGHFRNTEELFERAVRRLEALRGIGDAVDKAGLYERVIVSAGELAGL